MNWIIDLFSNHESVAYTVIIYAITIALGVMLGKIKIFGISLGITFVLFVGIILSHFGFVVNPEVQHFVKEFGLILFVYTIGLQVGPGFFASFKKEGLKLNLIALVIILMAAVVVITLHYTTGTTMDNLVGIMSGAVTNTPGLGAAQQTLAEVNPDLVKNLSTGYAIAYPFGVIGIILVMIAFKSIFKVNIDAEARLNTWKKAATTSSFKRTAIQIKNPNLYNKELGVLWDTLNFSFIVSRIFDGREILPAKKEMIMKEDDIILVIASPSDMEKVKNLVGPESNFEMMGEEHNSRHVVSRRVNVSQAKAYTKTLGNLHIISKYNVTISRVYRAGIEFIPNANTKLQFGDTITVIGEEHNIDALAKDFGNKKSLRTPHVAELFLGIMLGVLVGSIPFSIPGAPVPVKLGLAGGPLIVAILISRFGGKFSVTHYVSQSANLMVREIGIVLFLASVGLGAGQGFFDTLTNGDGLTWLLMGVAITLIPLLVGALLGRFIYKLDYLEMCGILAGASTDPPALAFAHQVTNSDSPALTYAAVYPFTTLMRILMAQLLILLFI